MKEQYIERYFEYRWYADVVAPLIILGVVIVFIAIWALIIKIDEKRNKRNLRRIEEHYKDETNERID